MHTQPPRRPVVLIILDGFGLNPSRLNNAVALADTPRLDALFARHPHTALQASGRAVGLPDGQMGNSEVGHMTLGCGAIMRQDLVVIDDAIEDQSFFTNPPLLQALGAAREMGRPVHLLGLVSDGGVHSHLRHLLALLKLCRQMAVRPVVHMICDGRDTAPRSALTYLATLEPALESCGGRIATLSGRYYAMDRDNRWERIEMAWRALVEGQGRRADSAREAVENSYKAGEDDEFLFPTVLEPKDTIADGDAVIFFNFRKDRPRQMVTALAMREFEHFDRGGFQGARLTCMMEYDEWYGLPYAFVGEKPVTTLAKVVSAARIKQFHCAETEKYAHVTFFLNGGRSETLPGEERLLIPSPQVPTYDMMPEMSATAVADGVISAVESGEYGFIVVNFANGDMVGHSAVRESVIQAVEVLDREAGRVIDAAVAKGYSVVLTADHGNCDEMVDPVTGQPHTRHTVYPVPCLIIDEVPWNLSIGAGLQNIAPTVLHLMGLPADASMQGRSLLLAPVKCD